MKRSRLRAMISRLRSARARIGLVHGRHGGVPGGLHLVEPGEELERVEARACSTPAPPAASEASVAAMRPWMWNSGMMLRQTSSGPSASVSPMWRAEAVTLRWQERHDLRARRWCPEVWSTSAVSSGVGEAALRAALRRGARRRASVNAPAPCSRSGLSSSDRDAELPRDGERRRAPSPRCDARAPSRLEVAQVELELLGAIGGVERRGGGARADADEGRRHLRPVGQHDRDPIVPPDAEAVQRLDRAAARATGGRGSGAGRRPPARQSRSRPGAPASSSVRDGGGVGHGRSSSPLAG